jgi:hypothetical protein
MLTWNDILDIELRNKDNPDVALLVNALENRVSITAVVECVESIESYTYWSEDDNHTLCDDPNWRRLLALCGMISDCEL